MLYIEAMESDFADRCKGWSRAASAEEVLVSVVSTGGNGNGASVSAGHWRKISNQSRSMHSTFGIKTHRLRPRFGYSSFECSEQISDLNVSNESACRTFTALSLLGSGKAGCPASPLLSNIASSQPHL